MANERLHNIRLVVKNPNKETISLAATPKPEPQPFNAGSSVIPYYHVQYQHQLICENIMIKPDGFSSILLENIGDDDCIIFGGIPLTNRDRGREYLNRPGEVITTQIPVQFAKKSANRQVLATKIYYERAK